MIIIKKTYKGGICLSDGVGRAAAPNGTTDADELIGATAEAPPPAEATEAKLTAAGVWAELPDADPNPNSGESSCG